MSTVRSRSSWSAVASRSYCNSRSCRVACWLRRKARLSGSDRSFSFLKVMIFWDWRSSSPESRSTSPLKKSSVSSARPVRIWTFSCRIRVTSSLVTAAACCASSEEKATSIMVAPPASRRPGVIGVSAVRARMSAMTASAGMPGWSA